MGDGEGAEGSGALGVHAAFWNDLSVEVGQLLNEPDVFQQRRTPLAGGCDVLVVVDGHAE